MLRSLHGDLPLPFFSRFSLGFSSAFATGSIVSCASAQAYLKLVGSLFAIINELQQEECSEDQCEQLHEMVKQWVKNYTTFVRTIEPSLHCTAKEEGHVKNEHFLKLHMFTHVALSRLLFGPIWETNTGIVRVPSGKLTHKLKLLSSTPLRERLTGPFEVLNKTFKALFERTSKRTDSQSGDLTDVVLDYDELKWKVR